MKYCNICELDVGMRKFWDAYKRQENDRNRIFKFLGQCDGEVALPWDDESDDESACERLRGSVMRWSDTGIRQTEDCMDANDIGKKCGSEHQQDNESHETLRWSIGD